jgi:hypothetical protein
MCIPGNLFSIVRVVLVLHSLICNVYLSGTICDPIQKFEIKCDPIQ